MPRLPLSFLNRPIAHRALHDVEVGRPENSLASVKAAVDAGYGIEIDLQLSRDAQPLVFHDYALERLTGEKGPVQQRDAAELAGIHLLHGNEGVPVLRDVLELVAGQVPILVEIKDQDGALGPDIGALEAATAQALKGYQGDVAVMSFNPHSVAEMAKLAPELPRGLVTEDFINAGDHIVPAVRRTELTGIPDFGRVGASFISHNHHHLHHPRVNELKAEGADILCWTVRSTDQEVNARKIAQNITFENYLAPIPG